MANFATLQTSRERVEDALDEFRNDVEIVVFDLFEEKGVEKLYCDCFITHPYDPNDALHICSVENDGGGGVMFFDRNGRDWFVGDFPCGDTIELLKDIYATAKVEEG